MKYKLKIDDTGFNKKLRSLSNIHKTAGMKAGITRIAKEIVKVAAQKAPKNTGTLKRSGFVNKATGKRIVKISFGFRSKHAEVMDTGFQKAGWLYPKNAKALAIPLGKGGIKRRKGQSKKKYIYLPRVKKPRLRVYGSKIGPNRYFTETVKRYKNRRLKAEIRKEISKAAK